MLTVMSESYIMIKASNFARKDFPMTSEKVIQRIPGERTTPSKFRARIGDFLARVQYGKETVVIVTRGKRTAILCPPENWCSEHAERG